MKNQFIRIIKALVFAVLIGAIGCGLGYLRPDDTWWLAGGLGVLMGAYWGYKE